MIFWCTMFCIAARAQTTAPSGRYSAWSNGPSSDPNFFPIAVWLQQPSNAARYKAAGFNTYIGLWEGPTEKQLADLKAAGMSVFCGQTDVGLQHVNDKTIVGWMQVDEPDNAQPILGVARWGSPIASEQIVSEYKRMQSSDPTRPILLNLGQGVAWDGWYGRGLRTNHPEDYPPYLRGCDIASFDIYPVSHDSPEVAGKLWFVPLGVDRLNKWSDGKKIIWNCIGVSGNEKVKPTPQQVVAQVWMSIIHGTRGLIYFVHQFKPKFIEAELLEDAPMLEAVTKLNHRIASLASVINGPSVEGISVTSSAKEVSVDVMAKRDDSSVYVFAVSMRPGQTMATISLPKLPASVQAEVLGENRSIPVQSGKLSDAFLPYQVHLYRMPLH